MKGYYICNVLLYNFDEYNVNSNRLYHFLSLHTHSTKNPKSIISIIDGQRRRVYYDLSR